MMTTEGLLAQKRSYTKVLMQWNQVSREQGVHNKALWKKSQRTVMDRYYII